jgi:hypothetical protein
MTMNTELIIDFNIDIDETYSTIEITNDDKVYGKLTEQELINEGFFHYTDFKNDKHIIKIYVLAKPDEDNYYYNDFSYAVENHLNGKVILYANYDLIRLRKNLKRYDARYALTI